MRKRTGTSTLSRVIPSSLGAASLFDFYINLIPFIECQSAAGAAFVRFTEM